MPVESEVSQFQPYVPPTTGLHIAFVCAIIAGLVHRTKKIPTDADKARTELWGFKFKPFTLLRYIVIALSGGVALVGLLSHAARALGTHALTVTLSVVSVSFWHFGLPQDLYHNLKRRTQGLCRRLHVDSPHGTPQGHSSEQRAAGLPVWVLTGFLGSGKTTLLNRLVRLNSGLLVVEYEAGDTVLDAQLVVEASGRRESVINVSGSCGRCSVFGEVKVRGDLCDLLRDEVLGERVPRGGVAGIIIECSGLADPAAVVQVFRVESEIQDRFDLREVVAVVDAAHVEPYLTVDSKKEAPPLARLVQEQITFASLVVLNKIDAVNHETKLHQLSEKIRRVNASADILQSTYCDIDLSRLFEHTCALYSLGGMCSPDRALVEIERLDLRVGAHDATTAGVQHKSSLRGKSSTPSWNPDLVQCASIRVDGELDLDDFNRWVIRTLVDMDLLRAKGVLAAKGYDAKLAFQAVGATFHGTPSLLTRWKLGDVLYSQIVVIGRDLRPDLIEYGLRRCLVKDMQ